jgi:hypothetical protein
MEYRIVHVRDIKGVEQQQEILNDMAADGWELVSESYRRSASSEWRWIFKRGIAADRPGRSEDAE